MIEGLLDSLKGLNPMDLRKNSSKLTSSLEADLARLVNKIDNLDEVPPTELLDQQAYLTDAAKAFKAETNKIVKQANDSINQAKQSKDKDYNELVNQAKAKLHLSQSYSKNAYTDLPFGSVAIGSVLKGAKNSKQQVVDELSSSFAHFISGKEYANFNNAMKDFRNSNEARVPVAKVNFPVIRKQLARVYSIVEDYRTNDSYKGKVGSENKTANIGIDSSVVAKMTRLDKGQYLLPLKHMPSMNSYDAAIGAMFRLFNDVDKLETVVASNGAKLSFNLTKMVIN